MIATHKAPSDDLAVFVFRSWVGAANRCLISALIWLLATVLVVCERAVSFGFMWVCSDSFWAIHRGSTNGRCGLAGENTNLCFADHPGGGWR